MVWKQLVTLVVGKYVGGISYVASGWKIVPTCAHRAISQQERHVSRAIKLYPLVRMPVYTGLYASLPTSRQRHYPTAGSRVYVPRNQWAHLTGGMQRLTACIYSIRECM